MITLFKDGSAQLTKNDPVVLGQDLSDKKEVKSMLSWWFTYVEAKKAGIEADAADIKRK